MAIFPFVPSVPGVPALLRAAGVVVPQPVLMIADAIAAILGLASQQWGLYQYGLPVVVADSVVSLGVRKQHEVSTYPIEPNSFESYDKVEMPMEGTVRFTAGGTDENRNALLQSIAAAVQSLDLYDVVMPEMVFRSVNPTSFDFRRTAVNGLGLLTVDVRFVEVRETASSDFTQTKTPSGAPPVNNGAVQAQPYRGPNLGPMALQ